MEPGKSASPRLRYPLESEPPAAETAAVGFQHVLAMFVGIVTPPLILAPALGFDKLETAFFLSMALIASGLSTFIQVRRFGPVGSGLLSVQGTSFTFVSPSLLAAQMGGPGLLIGMSMATAAVEAGLSVCLQSARKVFPPVVSGAVVMLIGLVLIRVGVTDLAGGAGAPDFGSPRNLLLGLGVTAFILLFHSSRRPFLSSCCVALGMLAGYALAAVLGLVDFEPVRQAGWLTVFKPLRWGLDFDRRLLLPFAAAYLVTTVESMGDLTATSIVSDQPVSGPLYAKRLKGGVLADALNSVLAGFLNSMPNTTFSQNNGLIQLTGVASRRVGFAVAAILVLLGMLPKLGALVAVMPRCVLGGATVVMFGMIVLGGMRIIHEAGLSGRNVVIVAVSLGLGLGVEFVPEALSQVPKAARDVFSSGLATGALAGMLLNLLLPERGHNRA